jgi:hypothetical protein
MDPGYLFHGPSQASQASQASQVKSASARAPGTHITIDRRDRQNHQILLKAPNNDPPRPGCPLPLCHSRKRNALVRCPLCGEWIRTVPLRRSRWVGPCRPCSWLVPIVIVSPAFPFKCCRYSQAGTFRIVTPVSSAGHDGVAGLTGSRLLASSCPNRPRPLSRDLGSIASPALPSRSRSWRGPALFPARINLFCVRCCCCWRSCWASAHY